jgi:hypothetical protein
MASADRGVCSAGLTMMVQPAARAGAHLAGDHGRGEIPRRDGGAHPHRLARDDDALVGPGRRNHFTVNAPGFFGKPLDVRGGVGNFTLGLGQGFALFGRHQQGQVIGIGQHQRVPAFEQVGAVFGGTQLPAGEGTVCRFNGGLGLLSAHVRHVANEFTVGWVVHGQRGAIGGRAPLAVDQCQIF